MEESKKRRTKSGLRGVARFCALQTLYKSEFCNSSVDGVFDGSESENEAEAFLTESISVSEMDKNFFKQLMNESTKNLSEIDEIIAKNLSKNWSMDRIDSITKCILRLGIAELMCFKETPSNVIFNEYIEIAKAFFDTPEVSFINGILNKVADCIRKKQ